MTFIQAIESVLTTAIRRHVWPESVTVQMREIDGEGRLMIWVEDDRKWHPWTLCATDMTAQDWELQKKILSRPVIVEKPPVDPSATGAVSPRPPVPPDEAPPVPSDEPPPDDGLDNSELLK